MHKKIGTLSKRQAKNKRKLNNTSKNNQNQQQPEPIGKILAKIYAVGHEEKKLLRQVQAICPKFNYQHDVSHLEFPQELSKVHNMFHVSNLKKCYADEPLAVLLDGLHLDDKLHFVEEPLEIVGREVKRLKRSRIPLVKVRWNSKRGPEFTWEREDQFKKKYPHLFIKTASSSSAAL
ncbi:hypothetical protein Tco_0819598 [Tanacetum coccineum]|uniref:Reverse transcriptase domain-containing protein n=1 Tax=Tanacetum coccineum TaxID=301880 RepID=A0ABQ5A8S0_9ASTR